MKCRLLQTDDGGRNVMCCQGALEHGTSSPVGFVERADVFSCP